MNTIDCRSPEGITIGLIDGIIAAARVVRSRDLTHPAVIEALRDIAEDEDVRSLLDTPSGADSHPRPATRLIRCDRHQNAWSGNLEMFQDCPDCREVPASGADSHQDGDES